MSRGHYSRHSNALEVKTVRMDGKSASLDSELERLKNRASEHSSYERYKANLHAIFEGRAPLPEHIREIAELREGTTPATPEPVQVVEKAPVVASKSQRRLSPSQNPYGLFTEALKRASTPDEIRRAVDAFREAGHRFPADEELLSKAITYANDESVNDLLDQLEALLETQPSKSPRLLASRLQDSAFSRHGAAKERILKIITRLRA